MPSHLKVGLVLASINGLSCLGWPHSKIMDELNKKERPLSIQFVDQLFFDPTTLDATSAPLPAFDASALLTPVAALGPAKPKRRLKLRHGHSEVVVKKVNGVAVPSSLLDKIRPGPVEGVRSSVGDEVPEEDEEAGRQNESSVALEAGRKIAEVNSKAAEETAAAKAKQDADCNANLEACVTPPPRLAAGVRGLRD